MSFFKVVSTVSNGTHDERSKTEDRNRTREWEKCVYVHVYV